jgi:hypothetical protein
MSAYNRGELSLEAYLVRILAALCRQNGGELRIKGELVDAINEPTTLLKDWDGHTQELVLRTHMGSFGEVFRVIPEKQPTKEVIAADPIRTQQEQPLTLPFNPPPKRSALSDEKLAEMETILTKRRVASMLKDELKQRRQPEA